jgi:ribose 5-phosphate isomerase A
MTAAADERTELKRRAAEHAVSFVASGSVIGLGTGSTAVWAVRKVGALLASGELHDVVAVPTSRETEAEARRLGIPLTTLEAHPALDLTIDGADEVDPDLNLIKGGGGALLHEKIVAQASRREIVVVDDAKLSPVLGTLFALPVEVVAFGQGPATAALEGLGASVSLRRQADGQPFISDEGNLILDADFGPIADLAGLAALLSARAAIVEHGLFLGLATDLVVAGADGVRHLQAQPRRDR